MRRRLDPLGSGSQACRPWCKMSINSIHPTSIIEPGVVLGHSNRIGPYCHIYNGVQIGDGNIFEGYASVGSPAEKRGFFSLKSPHGVVIGNENVIREFVTVNAGTRRHTVMGNNCTMLRGSHLSHDSILEDGVTVSCTAMIGGESHVMIGANLGLGAVLHQFSVVGSYSMIGMGAVCTKTLQMKPGGVYVGNPARYLKQNSIGLKRAGIDGPVALNAEALRWEKLRETNPC